jgi:hypothetical protein
VPTISSDGGCSALPRLSSLFGPLALVGASIGLVVVAGGVTMDRGAAAVAFSVPVPLLALVPFPALQLVLAMRSRAVWPA